MTSILFAYLHHLAAFSLFACIVTEYVLLRGEPSNAVAKQLRAVDGLYGLSAVLVLAIGFARVVWFEKGTAYYFSNHAFHLKLGLFIIVGLLSIRPTVTFLRWNREIKKTPSFTPPIDEWQKVRRLLGIQILIAAAIPLAAAAMARGLF